MRARSLTTSSATSCSSRRSLRSIDELDAEAERIAAEELAEVERKLIRKKLELQKKLNRNRSSGSSNASVRSSSSRRSRETGNGSELTCADRISLAERAQRAERAERNMGAALEEANGQIQDLLLDHQVQGERASGNEPNGTRPTPASARQSHPMNLTTHHFMARQSTAKDLPQLSGHADEWPAFIFALEHTTRECGFLNGENLGRLQKALRGKAKEAVQGMMTLPDNVGEVISILRMRFGRPDQIVQNLILKTKSQRGVKSEEAIEVLIEISALCRNLVATMRSTKCTGHLYNPQLVKELIGKLSGGLWIQWGEYVLKTGTDPHLDTFSAWLEQRAKAACLVAQPIPCDATHATPRTGQTFTVVEATAGKPHCLFCSKAGHTTSSCHQLAAEPLNARRQFVSDRRLCFRCLGEGHLARVCEEKACSCGKPHHPLLHRDGRGSVAPLERMSETTHTSATHVSEHSGRVLLRVIPVTVRNGDTAADTYALLDEGLTVSLIESELAEELGLAGPTQPLRLSWTDGKQHQESSSKVVTFSVAGRQRQDSFTLTNIHTHAKFNLPTQSINPQRLNNCPHLEGLDLPTLSCAKARLLIGQDNYSLIAPRVIAEGPPNTPVATQTKLGWVVHGGMSADRHKIDEGVVLSTWDFESTPTTEEAVALTREEMDVHEGGGSVIRNWVSNSTTVLESLPSDPRSPRIVNVHSHDLPTEKTPGLRWDPAKDTLGSCDKKLDPNAQVTKRSVLRHTMSAFDPLGLVSRHSSIARVLLQDVWRAGIGWDDELSASLAPRWTYWAAELDQVATVEVPRCYTPLITAATDIQLHVFADASEKAYGAAAYLRVANHDTQLAVSLVAAKVRVAPLKPASIYGLELQAAVLASQLCCTVREQQRISIPRVVLWTDSRTVLLWIRSDARQRKPPAAPHMAEAREQLVGSIKTTLEDMSLLPPWLAIAHITISLASAT
ncbi:uncharacterized protein LOC135810654 [Sycon ciliatum]|uniref:uncharacterized protein LOC135810654 n=1 Tax=Sycon ciliatum TaxID=27933 RepID=UPI0031F69D8E